MDSPKWYESKYFGMDKYEIMACWEGIRAEASAAGTLLHANIEKFYNGIKIAPDHLKAKDWKNFTEFHNFSKSFVTPYRTEWMIYDKFFKIAGMIDLAVKNKDGTYDIYDWKRSK